MKITSSFRFARRRAADGDSAADVFRASPFDSPIPQVARQYLSGRRRATNSGDIFVFTRTGHPTVTLGGARAFAHGGSRLFQFDKTGKFIREIGQGLYGFEQAQQVRVDRQDNVWIVDQMSSMVIKFDPNGQVQLLLGRKSEAERIPGAAPVAAAAAPPAGAAGRGGGGGGAAAAPGGGGAEGAPEAVADLPEQAPRATFFNVPPMSPDAAGNIYVSDGYGNSRIAKFDKNGKFIKSWDNGAFAPGQFNTPRGIAVDAQGNVYVADSGNRRIQVFDSEGTFKTMFLLQGRPRLFALRPAPSIHLRLQFKSAGRYRREWRDLQMDLQGRLVGRFGRAGKLPKEFEL
jgi:hypothetical protein